MKIKTTRFFKQLKYTPKYGETETMKLDKETLSAVGESLDHYNVPGEDRQLRFTIDGIPFCLDAGGCWRFSDDQNEMGWVKCTLNEAFAPMS